MRHSGYRPILRGAAFTENRMPTRSLSYDVLFAGADRFSIVVLEALLEAKPSACSLTAEASRVTILIGLKGALRSLRVLTMPDKVRTKGSVYRRASWLTQVREHCGSKDRQLLCARMLRLAGCLSNYGSRSRKPIW